MGRLRYSSKLKKERAQLKAGLSWQVVIIEKDFSISLALLYDPHFNLYLKTNANSR